MGRCNQGAAECGKTICCMECENIKECDYSCNENNTSCGDYEDTELVTLDQRVPEVIKAITDLMTQKKQLEEQEKKMREKLQQTMEQCGVKAFENEYVKFTYVAPTERKSIDTTKLKKEHPEIAEAYQKVTKVKASVKIEVK